MEIQMGFGGILGDIRFSDIIQIIDGRGLFLANLWVKFIRVVNLMHPLGFGVGILNDSGGRDVSVDDMKRCIT